MNDFERTITQMDFDYFGTGQHKIDMNEFLEHADSLLLDVRADEEVKTLKLSLTYHCSVLEIPMHKVPQRINEIPHDKRIGVFCSSGVRCVIIFAYLKSKGYENVKILTGGYVNLVQALLPGKVYKKSKDVK